MTTANDLTFYFLLQFPVFQDMNSKNIYEMYMFGHIKALISYINYIFKHR